MWEIIIDNAFVVLLKFYFKFYDLNYSAEKICHLGEKLCVVNDEVILSILMLITLIFYIGVCVTGMLCERKRADYKVW